MSKSPSWLLTLEDGWFSEVFSVWLMKSKFKDNLQNVNTIYYHQKESKNSVNVLVECENYLYEWHTRVGLGLKTGKEFCVEFCR